MGCCFSDVKGGGEAIGTRPQATGGVAGQRDGFNDAVDHFLQSKGFRGLYVPLELSLSGSKLCDLDILSKSDPMAVVYVKKQDGKLQELGRTEVMLNTLEPVWITKIMINYHFEIVQPLVFQVYDVDTKYHNVPVKSLKLNDQEFLGEASCILSEIVTQRSRSLTCHLQYPAIHPGRKLGTITCHAEETYASRVAVEMIFRCFKLENKEVFSKSDPFLRMSRVVESGGIIPICKTEVINNNLNPVWKPVILSAQQYGSKENPLVIECFDFNSSGTHELIGKLQASIAEFEKLSKEKAGAHFYRPSSVSRDRQKMMKSQLFVDKFIEKTQYSFLDYISSGFELNFMVAVDFTASNGNPWLADSLHYIDPSGRLNAYQQAIMGVGEVIQFYDSDRRFPAWGFGGRLPNGTISHCFNLSGNPHEHEVVGVEGIMSAYTRALHNFGLAGPTIFGNVIKRAAEITGQSLPYGQKYFILLIITDGVITDLQETKDAVVGASDLPLSILIVGVGGADFKEMEILDADNGKALQSSSGRVATRDIVQFVPMREVQGGQMSITQSLLEELPGQFLAYMRSRDIKPQFAHQPETYVGATECKR